MKGGGRGDMDSPYRTHISSTGTAIEQHTGGERAGSRHRHTRSKAMNNTNGSKANRLAFTLLGRGAKKAADRIDREGPYSGPLPPYTRPPPPCPTPRFYCLRLTRTRALVLGLLDQVAQGGVSLTLKPHCTYTNMQSASDRGTCRREWATTYRTGVIAQGYVWHGTTYRTGVTAHGYK
jgi:hypothetical protein